MSWINEKGPISDVVLSSRVRLARNLADTPFPTVMDKVSRDSVVHRVRRSVLGQESPIQDYYQFLTIEDLSPDDRQILVEKHLASPDLMEHAEGAAILVNQQEICSIMVNEEDHVRLQCIFPGYQLNAALNYINRIDDAIEGQLPYAFDENLGYLTCCPTNIGTGMRASVMMHLPALAATGQMKLILQTLAKIGIAVRGLYGEGSEAIGDIFQISNQITLGASEEEIITNLDVVAKQIVEKERQTRQALLQKDRIQFEDDIWRAYGIMIHAKIMNLKEFMNLLSKVRLGVEMGIIPNMGIQHINELMIMGQPAHLKKYVARDSNIKNLDIIRAGLAAQKLKHN
ncbi:MAG: protein arginine kinase [Clostridiales bacterium]|jgi:protein arginine kinase|nr:protein arginine kinase [Clostridiales bacterium]